MKIAAIDIGSTSFHMVIVEVGASGAFRVVGGEKDMVRLGERTLSRGRLPAAAMQRGLEILTEYRRLARTQGVEKIIAVATSAIREASNGEDFLDRIGREVGFYPKAISGEEEARLIYLAALHSVHLEGRRTLVVDIGGGSVEAALGSGARADTLVSEKIGVLRMHERFFRTDPISRKDESRLVRHVEKILEPHARKIRAAGFDGAVGTSGTVLALASLAIESDTGARPDTLHHVTIRADRIHALRKRLTSTDLRERLRMKGMDEARADIIVTGAIILDTLLEMFRVKELVLSDWALRQGILLNYIHRHPRTLARAEAYPDVRRRSVIELAERCTWDEAHSRHVSALALSIFDQTAKRHALGEHERSILEYSALLHDIGHHISHLRHHRHSYYLVKNGDLRGFHPEEIEILASVARYHRAGVPRRKHEGFGTLPPRARRTVRILASFLRLADALDRSHRQYVRGVRVTQRAGALRLSVEADRNVELEIWGARRRLDLLEKILAAPIRLVASPVTRPAALTAVKSAQA